MLARLKEDGKVVSRFQYNRDAETAAALCQSFTWKGLRFCCRQCDRNSSMAFWGAVKPEHDALMAWQLRPNGLVTISLYRVPDKPNVDLLKIATAAGGGGHPTACGFRMKWYDFSQFLEALMQQERGEDLRS